VHSQHRSAGPATPASASASLARTSTCFRSAASKTQTESSRPHRGESLSVWAFEEVFASSLPLPLTDTLSIRIPTVEGYAVAKLGAWLDRSEWHEAKDAGDLVLIMYWYAESTVVHDRLYDTPTGNEILTAERR
jgi:predicted nucleotidyltransferase